MGDDEMNNDILKYCMRGIVRYLNGDIEKFNFYKNKAMKIYHDEYEITIEDLIPKDIKIKLYKMVS